MEMNPNGTGARTDTDTRRSYPLPCGRTVEQVWEDRETGWAGAHLATCPHCATARASLEQLATATRLLVEDPAEPPATLLDTVMAAVRADLVRGDMLALPAPPGGTVDISTTALAAVLRYAVDTVAGVRAQRCRIVLDPDIPHTVRVWMSVSLRYGSGQLAALDQARQRVAAALSARVGLGLTGVNFEVADVWVDETTSPGVTE